MERAGRGFARVAAALACSMLGMLASGCSLGSSGTARPATLPANQQIVRLGLATNSDALNQLDPATIVDPNTRFISSLIFPPLLTADGQLVPEPWAAASMPVFDAANDTYTIQIRPNLRWSDGTPIDAATYAYSLNRTLNPCTGSPIAYDLYAIRDAQTFAGETCGADGKTIAGKIGSLVGDSITATGTLTLVIALRAPAPYFLQALTTPAAFAVPEQLIATYGERGWTAHLTDGGGFGGNLFAVKSWDQHTHRTTDHLVLSCLLECREGGYPAWGGHPAPPTLREVDVNFYRNPVDESDDYADGWLDEETVPSAAYRATLSGSAFHAVPALAITYFQMNWAKAPFDDVRVRQAFALALNKDVLAKQLGVSPTNHIVPQGMYGYDPGLVELDGTTKTTGNVAMARELLQSYADEKCGGQFSGCPHISMSYGGSCPNDTATVAVEQAAIQMWGQAFPGYPTTLQAVDDSEPLPPIGSTLCQPRQVMKLGWYADYADPQDWLSLQFEPGAPGNIGAVDIPEADTLMMQADQDFDASERAALYNGAEQLLVLDAAEVPIGQGTTYYNVRAALAGYAVTALGYPTLDQVYTMRIVKG